MAAKPATSGKLIRWVRTVALVMLGLIAVGSPQKYRPTYDPSNEAGRLHAAMAIVDHGSVYLDDAWDDVYPGWNQVGFMPNGDAAVKDGHYLLDKPPGITLLMVPVVALLRATGVVLRLPEMLWLLSLLLAALPAILFAFAFRSWIRKNLGDRRSLLLVAPAVVLATPWLLFGSQVFGHSLAACLAGLGAFLALGRLGADGPDEPPARGGFLGGLALGGAVLMEASSALLALGAVAALLLTPGRRQRLPFLILGGLGPLLVFLVWNWLCFGHPLSYGYAHKLDPSMAAAHARGALGLSWPTFEGIQGLLFSARRGLFFMAPWLILGPVGALWACRDRRISRAWRFFLLLATLGVPILLSGFSDWHGGQILGPRYLVFVIPLFGVAATLALSRLETGRAGPFLLPVVTGLVVSSLALQLVINAGIPAVDWEVGNPIREVVLPVMSRAGPLGTVWNPILGIPAGNIVAACAAIVLLVLWSTPPRRRRRPRAVAVAFFVGAALLHLGLVSVPRTVELPHQAVVLRARWFAYVYMGEEALSIKAEAEAIRLERR